jgi:tryptophan-rich sensory protein
MNKTAAALVSIASVAGAGLVGARFGPQRPREAIWYASLRKPDYTPPGPAIGAAWGVLETLLCVAGYRLLTRPNGSARGMALGGWAATLAGLAGYPAVFFGAKQLGPSTAVASAMAVSTAATAAAAARTDRLAAAAMLPLVLWTGFAVLLSEEVWRRNQGRAPRLFRA